MSNDTQREQTPEESFLHNFRKHIDACIKVADVKRQNRVSGYGREMSLVHTKLQEAKMWAGKCLEAINSPFPEHLRDEAGSCEDSESQDNDNTPSN